MCVWKGGDTAPPPGNGGGATAPTAPPPTGNCETVIVVEGCTITVCEDGNTVQTDFEGSLNAYGITPPTTLEEENALAAVLSLTLENAGSACNK